MAHSIFQKNKSKKQKVGAVLVQDRRVQSTQLTDRVVKRHLYNAKRLLVEIALFGLKIRIHLYDNVHSINNGITRLLRGTEQHENVSKLLKEI